MKNQILCGAIVVLCASALKADIIDIEVQDGGFVNVTVGNPGFGTSDATIHAGDSIRWTWVGGRTHSATSAAPGVFDSGLQDNGSVYLFTFTSAGTNDYYCMVHGFVDPGTLQVFGMSGRITVNAAGPTACSPADIASAGSSDPLSGPDGFVTGEDFDVFVIGYYKELRRADNTLISDITDGSGSGGPDGFITGTDFDRYIELFFQGC